jgi:hypothetical protein
VKGENMKAATLIALIFSVLAMLKSALEFYHNLWLGLAAWYLALAVSQQLFNASLSYFFFVLYKNQKS